MYKDYKDVTKKVGKISKDLYDYVDDIFAKMSFSNDSLADHYLDEF